MSETQSNQFDLMPGARRLAIIPARGGSKRIPNKNIREFCGKPIIEYILNAALESNLFSAIHVSTESQKIRDTVTSIGFPPEFSRSPDLSDDHTPLMPVLRHVIEEYDKRGQYFDEVWLLMSCAPLVRKIDLINAAILYKESGKKNPVLAVAEYPTPIEWAFQRNEKGVLKPVQPGKFAVRSQDLPRHYFDVGAFTIFSSQDVIKSKGAGTDADFLGYVMPKGTVIDIDDEQDWILAENLYRARMT